MHIHVHVFKGVTQMIVNVNQCASYFDETAHALKFSAVAKQARFEQSLPLPIR